MKAFIECEAGSNTKYKYCEKTFAELASFELLAPYPFPYGFIVGTASPDGDALDCFVITRKKIGRGTAVECEPVCTVEFHEGDELDHKILARLPDEGVDVDAGTIESIKDFITRIFRKFPDVTASFGETLDLDGTLALIEGCRRTD
jgi:inorganic pyrophosphatase